MTGPRSIVFEFETTAERDIWLEEVHPHRKSMDTPGEYRCLGIEDEHHHRLYVYFESVRIVHGRHDVTKRLPYGLTDVDLVLIDVGQDEDELPYTWHGEFNWLLDEAKDEEEVIRILWAAIALQDHSDVPLGMALRQAVIWERG